MFRGDSCPQLFSGLSMWMSLPKRTCRGVFRGADAQKGRGIG